MSAGEKRGGERDALALAHAALHGEGPYIVTAYRNGPSGARSDREELSWLRCNTIDDAQYELDEQIEANGGSIDEWPDVDADGGIIGPLPEHVYVEVRREVVA